MKIATHEVIGDFLVNQGSVDSSTALNCHCVVFKLSEYHVFKDSWFVLYITVSEVGIIPVEAPLIAVQCD